MNDNVQSDIFRFSYFNCIFILLDVKCVAQKLFCQTSTVLANNVGQH